jgi:hypothetical protein
MPRVCAVSIAAIAAFSFCLLLRAADDAAEKPPEHYRAAITIDYNRTKLNNLGVKDFPSLVDDVNTFLSRREFTLADLEAMHVWGSSAALKDVARFKVTFTRAPDSPKETKQEERAATPPPAVAANNQANLPAAEQKMVAQPVAGLALPIQPEAHPEPAPQPAADPPPETATNSAFHGRLPAHYTQVGVTELQRQKIYSIQGSYDAKITLLKNQLNEATAKRDAEVRGVLTADQQKQLDKLTGAAAKAQAAQKAGDPKGK